MPRPPNECRTLALVRGERHTYSAIRSSFGEAKTNRLGETESALAFISFRNFKNSFLDFGCAIAEPRSELLRELLTHRHGERGGDPDMLEDPNVIVQPKQERADGALA